MSDNISITDDTDRLSLSDIENAVKVIDYAADQGAFRGWDTIQQVLIVRERLNVFLDAAKAYAETEAKATEAEDAPVPAEAGEAR